VPVIVLFKKTDFFDDEAIEYLLKNHICQTIEEAREKTSQQDWLGFEKQFVDQISRKKHQPKGHVFLRGKHICFSGL
jgi:hypothetical protein